MLIVNKTGEIIESGCSTGRYISRYYAKKQANETDVVIKDGKCYRILSYQEYKKFLKEGKK